MVRYSSSLRLHSFFFDVCGSNSVRSVGISNDARSHRSHHRFLLGHFLEKEIICAPHHIACNNRVRSSSCWMVKHCSKSETERRIRWYHRWLWQHYHCLRSLSPCPGSVLHWWSVHHRREAVWRLLFGSSVRRWLWRHVWNIILPHLVANLPKNWMQHRWYL